MKKLMLALMAMMLVVGLNGYAEEGHEGHGEGDKGAVQLEQLPAAVKEAVQKEVEGIELVRAKMEKTDAGVVYTILGHVKEVKWMVKVTVDGDGKVTSVKATKVEKKPEGGDKAPEGGDKKEGGEGGGEQK